MRVGGSGRRADSPSGLTARGRGGEKDARRILPQARPAARRLVSCPRNKSSLLRSKWAAGNAVRAGLSLREADFAYIQGRLFSRSPFRKAFSNEEWTVRSHWRQYHPNKTIEPGRPRLDFGMNAMGTLKGFFYSEYEGCAPSAGN